MPFNDYPNYLGLILVPLAAAAWFTRRRSLVLALGTMTLLATLLAMGRFSPGVYQLAYSVLPFFTKFRVPSMAMVVPALMVAILAALGAWALTTLPADQTPRLRRVAWAVLAVGGCLLLGGATGLVADAYRDQLAALAARSGKPSAPALLAAAWTLQQGLLVRQGLVLLVFGGALMLAAGRPGFRALGLVPVLALMVAVDLGSVARLVTHPESGLVEVVRTADGSGRLAAATRLERTWRPQQREQLPADFTDLLRREVGHDRVLPLGGDAGSNAFMTAGVRSLGGYHAAKPAAAESVRRRLFDGVPSGPVARWLGAAVVTYPGDLGVDGLNLLAQRGLRLEPIGAAGGRVAYHVLDALPRARLVDTWLPVPAEVDGLDAFLDGLAGGRIDPAAGVRLNETPDPLPRTGPERLPEPEFVQDGTDRVVIRARTPRPALLLLSDLVTHGWQVAVDGEPARLLVADHVLRAVALPSGDHEVCFEYRDPAFTRGLWLAIGGLAAALLLIVWPAVRRRAATPSASRGE